MKFNPQKHHRRSIRLKEYYYSKAGLNFITICTHNRECLFGKIINDEMILNDAGKIANECWMEIPKHFPKDILHEHVVMPNHVHGIIELTQNNVPNGNAGAENFLPLQPNDNVVVSTNGAENFMPIPIPPPQSKLPRTPVWQRNYHEHIIRNEQSYQNISNYIINNPSKWKEDKFYRF